MTFLSRMLLFSLALYFERFLSDFNLTFLRFIVFLDWHIRSNVLCYQKKMINKPRVLWSTMPTSISGRCKMSKAFKSLHAFETYNSKTTFILCTNRLQHLEVHRDYYCPEYRGSLVQTDKIPIGSRAESHLWAVCMQFNILLD